MTWERAQIALPVRGGFDLRAVIASGGGSVPPPWRWRDGARPLLERPERLPDGSVRLLRVRPDTGGILLQVTGRSARDVETLAPLAVRIRRALGLDVAPAALRGTTVFEDLVGVLAASRAAPATVQHALAGLVSFGSRCPADRRQRAFPAPEVLARLSLRELRQRTGCGHRAAWLRALARDVAGGALDLQRLDDLSPRDAAHVLRTIDGLGPAGVRAALRVLGHAGVPAAPPRFRPAPTRAPRTRPGVRS